MTFTRYARAAMIVTSTFAATTAAAKPPLETTNKWVVDFAEHQCLASRNYGTAEKPVFLILKPSPVGAVMQIAVATKDGPSPAQESDAVVRFDDAPPVPASLISYSAAKAGIRFNSINLPTDAFAPMRTAASVSISADTVNRRFALGPMAPLMRAIDRCLVDLKRHWNVDGAASGGMVQPPRPTVELVKLFSSDDYPGVAVRRGATGTVGLVTLVDESGKIGDCMVTETSKVASLDSQACAIIIERAKFAPARGADGKPVKGALAQRVRWALP